MVIFKIFIVIALLTILSSALSILLGTWYDKDKLVNWGFKIMSITFGIILFGGYVAAIIALIISL